LFREKKGVEGKIKGEKEKAQPASAGSYLSHERRRKKEKKKGREKGAPLALIRARLL